MATLPVMRVQASTFQTDRADLAKWRLHQQPLAAGDGEVLVRVEHFALTANNITYGVAGDSIGYWRFFPAEDPWGCIPVWGFGRVLDSRHGEVPVGERLYGYFPMSTHVLLTPDDVRRGSLVDGAEHRRGLPAVYNQYARTAADPAYDPAREAEQMLYRPLFTTSFLLDDFLDDNDFFAAGNVILTSASSKTAVGLAHLLHQHRRDRCRVVGLTSAGNRDFVSGLGCYHEVYAYQDVARLPVAPSVMVDMAGSGPVRAAVHGHLRDELKHSCAVGATPWDADSIGQGAESLPGPRPEMFFAPARIGKRLEEWGAAGYQARLAAAWEDFLAAVSGWIRVEAGRGPEALAGTYAAFIRGTSDPAAGYVMSLHEDH